MTDFKIKMAELAKKYHISHQRDIDWHNFVAEVEELTRPELAESENERIRRELKEAFEAYDIESSWNGIPIRSIFAWLEKQKPAEWSEVELEFRGEKVKVKRPFFRDDNGRGYSTTEQDEDVAWYALRAWCEKKGVSMYDLYPRAEWSEEDEKKIHFLSRLIEFQVKDDEYCFGDGRLISKKEAIEMLKSLRPQSKEERSDYITPNKEFFQWIYDRLVNVHKENPDVDYMRTFKKRIDNLDFGGQPRWKPSEEQMKALPVARRGLHNGSEG